MAGGFGRSMVQAVQRVWLDVVVAMVCARWGEAVRRDGDGDGFAGRADDAAKCPVPRKFS